jgi:NitT/TauT family transport system permease protein
MKERTYRLISLLSPLVCLLLWELSVRAGLLDGRFFPPPSRVLSVLGTMVLSGELWDHLSASLWRIAAGFVIGVVPGVLTGLAMGWSRAVRAALDPLVAATYPLPKIAILPLLLLIFGIGEASKVAVVAIAAFFMVVITTAHGVMQIDPALILAARSLGAGGGRLFTRVVLPAILPAVFTGLRLALGMSLLVIVAAEFVAADRGIGYLIWISWSTLSVAKMYAGLVTIAALGLLFTAGLERAGRVLMPWAVDRETDLP